MYYLVPFNNSVDFFFLLFWNYFVTKWRCCCAIFSIKGQNPLDTSPSTGLLWLGKSDFFFFHFFKVEEKSGSSVSNLENTKFYVKVREFFFLDTQYM